MPNIVSNRVTLGQESLCLSKIFTFFKAYSMHFDVNKVKMLISCSEWLILKIDPKIPDFRKLCFTFIVNRLKKHLNKVNKTNIRWNTRRNNRRTKEKNSQKDLERKANTLFQLKCENIILLNNLLESKNIKIVTKFINLNDKIKIYSIVRSQNTQHVTQQFDSEWNWFSSYLPNCRIFRSAEDLLAVESMAPKMIEWFVQRILDCRYTKSPAHIYRSKLV